MPDVRAVEVGSHADCWPIVPTTPQRTWMNEVPQNHIYRCLPLTLANATGWDILAPCAIEVGWNGTMAGPGDLLVTLDDARFQGSISSQFGCGILTFNIPYVFRTDEPVGLWVRGPTNVADMRAYALEGLVETWWLPFTFTMNWKIQRPYLPMTWAKGDPICTIVPIDFTLLQNNFLQHQTLQDQETSWQKAFREWSRSRTAYNTDIRHQKESGAQSHYHRGIDHTGGGTDFHLSRTLFNVVPKGTKVAPEA